MSKKKLLKNTMHNYAKVISFLNGAIGCTIDKKEDGEECFIILCESEEALSKLKPIISGRFGAVAVELRLKETVEVKGA